MQYQVGRWRRRKGWGKKRVGNFFYPSREEKKDELKEKEEKIPTIFLHLFFYYVEFSPPSLISPIPFETRLGWEGFRLRVEYFRKVRGRPKEELFERFLKCPAAHRVTHGASVSVL